MKLFSKAVFVLSLLFSFVSPSFAETASPPLPPKVVSQSVAGSSVNINTADAQAIVNAHIKGIGKKRAEQIVAYRQQHGPFKSPDDLKNIKGLSQKIIDENRSRLLVQ